MATTAAGVGKMITLTSGDLKVSQHTRSPAHAPAEAAPSRTWALTRGCLWRGRREQTYPHAFAAVSPRGTRQAQGTLGQRETTSQHSEKSTRNADFQASLETYDIGQGLRFNKTCRGPYAPVSPMPPPPTHTVVLPCLGISVTPPKHQLLNLGLMDPGPDAPLLEGVSWALQAHPPLQASNTP